LENLSFSYSGQLLQVAEYLLLAIPDDSIPIFCLPHFHGRCARGAELAAAKPSDLQSLCPSPPRPDRELFKTLFTT